MDGFQFLIDHGEWVLFAIVLAEQAGLPLPSTPLLFAAGAMAGAGLLNGPLVIALSMVAALVPDVVWFELGRRHGNRVLGLLCKISLEPDACKRLTERMFARHGLPSLLIVKFVPGLSTIAPPLAGISGIGFGRFLLYDAAGALIWIGTCVGLGALFSDQLEWLSGFVVQGATAFGGLVAALIVGYIAYKLILRTLLIRRLRVARISPDELRQMMEDGGRPVVIDLRHPLDVASSPYGIPGALRMSPEELNQRHHEIPREREVILYCS